MLQTVSVFHFALMLWPGAIMKRLAIALFNGMNVPVK